MLRRAIVAMAALAVLVGPGLAAAQAQAQAQSSQRPAGPGGGQWSRRDHDEHNRGQQPVPVTGLGYIPAACGWAGGYWGYFPYVDVYGQYWYVPQWIPPQYVCY